VFGSPVRLSRRRSSFVRLVVGGWLTSCDRRPRGVAAVVAAVVVGSLLIGVQASAAVAGPTVWSAHQPPPVDQPPPVRATPVEARPRPADLAQGAGRRPTRTVVWPSAGAAEATLVGRATDPRAVRGDGPPTKPVTARAGQLPVWVGPAAAGLATGAASRAGESGPGYPGHGLRC